MSRRIWDRSDHYLKAKYGFSILDIIRTNPDKVVIDLKVNGGEESTAEYARKRVCLSETIRPPSALDQLSFALKYCWYGH